MTISLDTRTILHIQDAAFRTLPAKRRAKNNLYILEEIKTARSKIKAGHQQISIKKPTVVVFVDEEPLANWAHNCRYMLYDAENGELYKEIKADFPPYLVHPPETFKAFHLPVVAQNPRRKIWSLEIEVMFPWRFPKGNRYAILFSGASNNRHVNDLEFLYRQLVDRFYFDEADITVLNYDGTLDYTGWPQPATNWPGDGSPYRMPVDDAGTKQALADAIDALKPKLKQDDLLLIHTNNHGGHNGTESYLCTYSGPNYTATDFANKLGELPVFADLIVMMEQCRSGGFNDVVIEASTATRTTFAAACTEGKNSIGGADFDPFARDWISAFANADPYGAGLLSNPDYDGSGKVSAREAFAYADDVHNAFDSPVYSAFGTDAGDQHLYQKWLYLFHYRDYILEELRWLYDKIEDPVQYRKIMRLKVLPDLVELDDRMAVSPPKTKSAQQTIRQIIRSAMKEKDIREFELEQVGD